MNEPETRKNTAAPEQTAGITGVTGADTISSGGRVGNTGDTVSAVNARDTGGNVADNRNTVNAVNTRDTSMDLLRILACVMVVMIHVSSQNWYASPPDSAGWAAMNLFDSMARPAVPIFLMLSGAFMLDPGNAGMKKLWLGYIPRLAAAYILWSLVYAFYERYTAGAVTLSGVIKSAVTGQYHLWYLPVIIELYILLPLFRKLLSGPNARKYCDYMLLLFLVFGILKNTLLAFDLPHYAYIETAAAKLTLKPFSAYAGYFLLGYRLYHYKLPKPVYPALWALGLISAPVCAVITREISLAKGAPDDSYYSIFSVTALIGAAALFTFFKAIIGKLRFSRRFAAITGFIANRSFGVYLVHVLVMLAAADYIGINTLGFGSRSVSPWLSVPALTAAVYLASLALTSIWGAASLGVGRAVRFIMGKAARAKR